jgi:hypothetical protein
MTGLPIEYPFRNDPEGVITDADREGLGARLNQAYSAGVLQMDEYQRLLDELYAAKQKGELVAVATAIPTQFRDTSPAVGGDQPGLPPGQLAVQQNNLPAGLDGVNPAEIAKTPLLKFVAAGVGVVAVLVILLLILL